VLSLKPLNPKRVRVLALVIVSQSAVLVPVSHADTPDDAAAALPPPATRTVDAEADRQATRGQRLLDRGQTQEAIAAFRRAYELRADARFLCDIAECYRQLGLADQAIHFYRRYLSVAPDAADRDEVEAQIAELEKLRPHPAAPAAPPPAQPAPNLTNDVVIMPLEESPPPPRPLWRTWWAWTALGALVAGGVVLAVTLGRQQNDVPATTLGDKRFF